MNEDNKKTFGFYVTTIRVGEGLWIDDIFISVNKIKSGHQVSLGVLSNKKRKISKEIIQTKEITPKTDQ